MAKEFMIETPDQLRELRAVIKNGNVDNVATVWSADRRKGVRSPWDGKIFARFESVGRGRRAQVYRMSMNGNKRVFAELKYYPALGWCQTYLKMVDLS